MKLRYKLFSSVIILIFSIIICVLFFLSGFSTQTAMQDYSLQIMHLKLDIGNLAHLLVTTSYSTEKSDFAAIHTRTTVIVADCETLKTHSTLKKLHLQQKKNFNTIIEKWNITQKDIIKLQENSDEMQPELCRSIIGELQNLQSLLDSHDQLIRNHINEWYSRFWIITLIVIILLTVGAFTLSIINVTAVIHRVRNVQDVATRIADRDLSQKIIVRGHDEITKLSQDLNLAINFLKHFVNSAQETAATTAKISNKISQTSSETSIAANEIKVNTESLQNIFEELNTIVDTALTATNAVVQFANELEKSNTIQNSAAQHSSEVITQMAESITSIAATAKDKSTTAKNIRLLVNDSDEKVNGTSQMMNQVMTKLDDIVGIAEIINSIAEQTSILSLNAAIESAHAGEAGKGFSVVAEEIGHLADSTAANASKINENITVTLRLVKEACVSSNTAVDSFSKIAKNIDDLVNAMTGISDEITSIGGKTEQITQQSTGIAAEAGEISKKSETLVQQQKTVFNQLNGMKDIFDTAMEGIKDISHGTKNILDSIITIDDMSRNASFSADSLNTAVRRFTIGSDNDIDSSMASIFTAELSDDTIEGLELLDELDSSSITMGTPSNVTDIAEKEPADKPVIGEILTSNKLTAADDSVPIALEEFL